MLEAELEDAGDALLGCLPRKRAEERLLRGDEVAAGRQRRVVVDQRLGQRQRGPIPAGDPSREAVDERVELVVGDRAVDVAVALGGLGVVVLATEDDLERSRASDQPGQALGSSSAGKQAEADL